MYSGSARGGHGWRWLPSAESHLSESDRSALGLGLGVRSWDPGNGLGT